MAPSSDIRPWYRWHWYRYRKSDRTLALSLAGHGAYRNLLDAMWERGGTLPADRNLLWRLALAESREEYEAVADQVEAFFTVSENGQHFTNETLVQEWQETTEYLNDIREKRSAAGKKGNASRWRDHESSQADPKDIANAIASPSRTDRNRSHSSSTSSSTEAQHLSGRPDVAVEIVQQVFTYFTEKLGKSAAYVLTPKRQQQGIARYREALKAAKRLCADAGRDPGPDELPEMAEKLMYMVVDKLAASEFHSGKNDQSAKYQDWHHVFESAEKFSRWLEEGDGKEK